MSDLTPRQRAGATKRQRTAAACLDAATRLFETRGWNGTRLEDVAREAGVSVATLHNHFATKQVLIGHVYRDRVVALIEEAQRKIMREEDPLESVRWCVRSLARMTRERRRITLCLVAAVQEQTIKTDGPPLDDDDVRRIAPFPTPLVDLIAYGQRAGAFSRGQQATDIGTYHANALLLRVMTRPAETAEETTNFVLSQLLPSLVPSKLEALRLQQVNDLQAAYDEIADELRQLRDIIRDAEKT